MTIGEARDLFSRTVHEARLGCIDGIGIKRAIDRLARVRDRKRGRERRQIELYLGLLEDEWQDATALTATTAPGGRVGHAQRVLLETLQLDGPRPLRLTAARSALTQLVELAREADGPGERAAIARLSEPLILLVRKLERELPVGVAR
jgi:hypothetical protein